MSSIGEALRRAREEKGISLDKAEEDTKIRRRYLEALEDEEYDVIPGAVYAKGFLRNYALYLGLNPEEVLIQYKLKQRPVKETGTENDEEKPDIAASISKRRATQRTNKKIYRLTVIVAAVAILTFALYSALSKTSDHPGQELGNKPPQTEQNNTTDNQEQNQAQNPEPNAGNGQTGEKGQPPENTTPDTGGGNQGNPSGEQNSEQVNAVLAVSNQSCWAKVTVDGKTVFSGNIEPGQTKSFRGKDKITFRLGNAGAVSVTVNGKNLGVLGAFGQVVTREVTPAD